jgi:hypothetical protein
MNEAPTLKRVSTFRLSVAHQLATDDGIPPWAEHPPPHHEAVITIVGITVIAAIRVPVSAIPAAIEATEHGTADQAGSERASEPESTVVEASVEAAKPVGPAEAMSGKSSMVESTHTAHVVESTHVAHSAHVAAKASHPSLSRNGNAERGHSEHGGRQDAFYSGSEDHDAFSSCEMNTRRPCGTNALRRHHIHANIEIF